jgi:hypothetical protein
MMVKQDNERRSWIVVFQPRDAEQFDFATMKVIDCWRGEGGEKAAYIELNSRVERYVAEHGDGKISLFAGNLQAHFLHPFIEAGA